MRLALAVAAFLAGCSGHAGPKPASEPATPGVQERARSATDRLLKRLPPDGFVVSFDDAGGGVARAQGDSLIWTGIALASVPCDQGTALEDAIQTMMSSLDGGFWRHPSLPTEISLDGALGAYRGIAHRVKACGEAGLWAAPMKAHLRLAADTGGHLNSNAGTLLPVPWTYVRDLLAAELGLRQVPGDDLRRALEGEIGDWAGIVKTAHETHIGSDACYRVHLGLLALQTVEELGADMDGGARDLFCGNTSGMDLPTTNHWCGRDGLKAYLDGYQENAWEYRHQRCAGWETPDGDGLWRPGVDYLRGLADFYAL